jgi:hypothetical protein
MRAWILDVQPVRLAKLLHMHPPIHFSARTVDSKGEKTKEIGA